YRLKFDSHDDDSDSKEDMLPASPLDLPGPSGLTPNAGNAAMDKATAGTKWQDRQDITVTVVSGVGAVRKRGHPRKKDIGTLPLPPKTVTPPSQQIQGTVSGSATVTIIEEYVPASLTSQQASILNAASANLEQPQNSRAYNLMGTPPLDLFGVCPNVRVKRRFITPEQKQRQLELARARKKRFRERLKEKALLQKKTAELSFIAKTSE
ncbi:hypothetical protein L9F63_011037, partial [Diploptera punctata]